MSIYDYSVKDRKGNDFSLSNFKGKVVLIVNTATGCGFTPQYKDLEEMYEKYHDKGFEILDIPCNQFGHQAPGSDEEIHEFCSFKYQTKFDQMKKADVNGENELPLYKYLKEQKPFVGFGKGAAATAMKLFRAGVKKSNPDIRWNFTKFLVDKEGNVVARFEPTHKMEELDKLISELLK